MTKYHSHGGLNNRNAFFYLTVLKVGKAKIKVSVNSVPSESSLPGFQTVIFSLSPQMAERAL